MMTAADILIMIFLAAAVACAAVRTWQRKGRCAGCDGSCPGCGRGRKII